MSTDQTENNDFNEEIAYDVGYKTGFSNGFDRGIQDCRAVTGYTVASHMRVLLCALITAHKSDDFAAFGSTVEIAKAYLQQYCNFSHEEWAIFRGKEHIDSARARDQAERTEREERKRETCVLSRQECERKKG